MKKTLAVFLFVIALLLAIPARAEAATEHISEQEAIHAELLRVYSKCLDSAQVESFTGYCGLMTSHVLWHLGINAELGPTYDGNKHYEHYANMSMTSGGYRVTAYPGEEYTLDQALNAITRNGTQDAENILVGFESTTSDAGQVYGHALVIHTIMDGMVYFIESFDSSTLGMEGSVLVCTVQEFINFYDGWTVLDGVVHFGDRRYSDSCQSFATDLYVRTRFSSTLRSEPCLLGDHDSKSLRSLIPGELLHATAVYMNPQGERYYYVDDGAITGYVAAHAVSVVQLSDEALYGENISLPAIAAQGEKLTLSGRVAADNSSISAIRLTVTDAENATVMEAQLDVVGSSSELSPLNEQLDFSGLQAGEYTVNVYATSACVSVRGTGLVTQYKETLVHTQSLAVGQLALAQERQVTEQTEPLYPDGWFLRGGTWYCYQFQKPCIGWVTRTGVDYYLQKDGSVTTGLAEVDGWLRYFSGTGALCYGWVTVEEGTYHWLPDGSQAIGWHTIDGKLYCFDERGLLLTRTSREKDGITYDLQPDGTAVARK